MAQTAAKSQDLIERARSIVEDMKGNDGKLAITTSQIRKFLAGVNRLENKYRIFKNDYISQHGRKPDKLPAEMEQEIRFLEVKLIYQVGRENNNYKKEKLKQFYNHLAPDIKNIGNNPEKFEEFCRLMEAITAFHKYEGGGE
ncbi:CRISPR-associated protein Csm2 [Thermosyntropha lipolytica DSM 11003]|uniref:CRISPR system Cms protein Csm2 n=1 Tax=Thermosyntropha lipolytica DSM 11003 TaxID=1123382 RepID=A0A1M5RL87_9FIRM|nr:type III-A CRISPR-associated protein Csm2 [Thermosyntropha lipolytica]SHH26838.1 CRISPR-associated protein Csm2 [Thermosyntropha lipolytica DSM 11003]